MPILHYVILLTCLVAGIIRVANTVVCYYIKYLVLLNVICLLYQQEIRSVKHGYLSHCFKCRTRDLGHVTLATPPLGSFIIPYVVLAMAYPTKKNEESTFIHLKVMESEVPKFKK